jgi:hypothetical protein
MNNECIPLFEAAYTQKLTVHFTSAGVGKTFSGPITTFQGSGATQGPNLSADPLPTDDGGTLIVAGVPAAGGEVGGVIGWDVPINGKGPIVRGGGTILPVTSSAAVNAGDELKVDTAGKVLLATTGTRVVGKAHNTVAGANLDVYVELYGEGGYMKP